MKSYLASYLYAPCLQRQPCLGPWAGNSQLWGAYEKRPSGKCRGTFSNEILVTRKRTQSAVYGQASLFVDLIFLKIQSKSEIVEGDQRGEK